MSRTFWFAAGAASGVYALVKAKRTARNFTPDGVAARVAAWRTGAQLFAAEVATGMAEREAAIRKELAREELALPVARPAAAAAPRAAVAATAAAASALEPARPHDPEGITHGHR
jgi:Family of unknown function (DUF6167)